VNQARVISCNHSTHDLCSLARERKADLIGRRITLRIYRKIHFAQTYETSTCSHPSLWTQKATSAPGTRKIQSMTQYSIPDAQQIILPQTICFIG
jgi:hypothetical protein